MNFNRCLFTDGVKKSMFLKDVVNQNSTFDIRYLNRAFKPGKLQTPFTNIRICAPHETIPDEKKWILEQQPVWDGSFQEYILALKLALKAFFEKYILSNQKYLFSCSSGMDSRFIAGVLAEMIREGYSDFSNIHFRCHSPENEAFVDIMKKLGLSNYSTFNHSPDCYGIGVDYIDVNGWCPYSNQMNYWSDLITDPKEWVIITGEGGELFKYIGKKLPLNERFTANYELDMLIQHNPGSGEWDNQNAGIFKKNMLPLFSYEYMAVSNRINHRFIQPVPKTGWDNIRVALARSVGLDDAVYIHDNYAETWRIPQQRKQAMISQFYEGAFYSEYKNKIHETPDFFSNPFGWDACLWGFAVTLYDKIFT